MLQDGINYNDNSKRVAVYSYHVLVSIIIANFR